MVMLSKTRDTSSKELGRLADWRVSHSWREGNRCADELAKKGAKGRSTKVLMKGMLPRRLAGEDKRSYAYERVKGGEFFVPFPLGWALVSSVALAMARTMLCM